MPVILKKDLIDSLDRIRATVSSSDMIQVYKCFCFRAGTALTFNGQAGTITNLDVGGLSCAVPADKFYRLCSSMTGEIDLKLNEKGVLTIKSGKNKTTLNTLPANSFPNIVPGNPQFYSDSRAFVTALKRIGFSVGTNATKPQLLGIGIKGWYAYSADGTRMSRFKLDKEHPSPMLIPSDSIDHLVKLGNPTQFVRTPNQLIAYYDETKTWYVTALMAFEFPFEAVDTRIATFSSQEISDFPEMFAFALGRVALLAPTENSDIVIENKPDGLHITAASEYGDAGEILEWGYKKPFKFAVNPTLLKKAFESSTKVDLGNVIYGDKRALVFTDADGLEHVLALMGLRE